MGEVWESVIRSEDEAAAVGLDGGKSEAEAVWKGTMSGMVAQHQMCSSECLSWVLS